MKLPPPERSSLDHETSELLALATAPSGKTAETIGVLAHSPGLVAPFLTWAMALHTAGVELIVVAGQYTMLSMLASSTGPADRVLE